MLLKLKKASRKGWFTYYFIKKTRFRFNVNTSGMKMGYDTCGFLLPLSK